MERKGLFQLLFRWLPVVTLAVASAFPLFARQEDGMAPAVRAALESKNYKVDVDFMMPMKGRSRALTTDYYLAVRGDSLFSYLPYVGEAYNLPYGGGKGLVFDAPIESYRMEPGKKGRVEIQVRTRNDEDSYLYHLTVQPNGSVSLRVQPTRRQAISFNGEIGQLEE